MLSFQDLGAFFACLYVYPTDNGTCPAHKTDMTLLLLPTSTTFFVFLCSPLPSCGRFPDIVIAKDDVNPPCIRLSVSTLNRVRPFVCLHTHYKLADIYALSIRNSGPTSRHPKSNSRFPQIRLHGSQSPYPAICRTVSVGMISSMHTPGSPRNFHASSASISPQCTSSRASSPCQ